jgi:hypothetical protein
VGGPPQGQGTCAALSNAPLNGTYALYARLFSDVKAAGGLFNMQGIGTELWLKADFAQQGNNLAIRLRPCAFTLPMIAGVAISVPPALVASVGDVVSQGQVQGCNLQQNGTFGILLGSKVANPVSDPTPDGSVLCGGTLMPCSQAQGAGCVCDQEPDQKPGATLGIQTGLIPNLSRIYSAVQVASSLTGQIMSRDMISGTLGSPAVGLSMFGCGLGDGSDCDPNGNEMRLLKIGAPMIAPSATPSTFNARRIADNADCSAVPLQAF